MMQFNDEDDDDDDNNGMMHDADVVQLTLHEIFQLQDTAFDILDHVYVTDFKRSPDFQKLYKQMQDNMIEYRFLTLAGMGAGAEGSGESKQ